MDEPSSPQTSPPEGAPAGSGTSYDAHPYPGYAYWFTHPDHLYVTGTLYGLSPALPAAARVLELGCGDGGNVVAIAALLPGTTCVGIDLSDVQIASGRQLAAALGIANVTLHQGDLTTLVVRGEAASGLGDLGEFDYIIAHGVYAWVPAAVRDALLACIKAHLAPNGVALVSYNALPGWNDLDPVRRLMKFHTDPVAEPAEKIRQAREVADWYAKAAAAMHPERAKLLERVGEVVAGASESLVRHDWLAEYHGATLFSDFAAHADQHGLAYLANAIQGRGQVHNLEPEVRELVERVPSRLRQQQYLDFFENTRFRTTALCHRGQWIDDPPPTERYAELAIESRMDVDPWAIDTRSDAAVLLETASGFIEVAGKPFRVVLSALHRHRPRAVPMRVLFDEVSEVLAGMGLDGGLAQTPEGREALFRQFVGELSWLYLRELVHFWRDVPDVAGGLPERPRTGILQRTLAASRNHVTSLHHRHVALTDDQRALVPLLDGTRDRAGLAAAVGRSEAEVMVTLEDLRVKGFIRA